jgi:hypothetical protein
VPREHRDDPVNVLARIVAARERLADGDVDEADSVLRDLEEEIAAAETAMRRAA